MKLFSRDPETTGHNNRPPGPEFDPGNENLDELLDLLPEFRVYRDTGCELAPSCLECPFPECVEDRPRGRRVFNRIQLHREIARVQAEQKLTSRELAVRFKVSQRTVFYALKNNREEQHEQHQHH